MLHLLPLEPLDERYTAQWAAWFPDEFQALKLDFDIINGMPLTNSIETGDVLDAFGTNYWKMTQLAALMSLWREGRITAGDTLFSTDLWHPGIESIAYTRDLLKQDVRLVGILHAGTWDKTDFTVRHGMNKWAHGFEETLFDIIDEAYVGSQHHWNLIDHTSSKWSAKTRVTLLPFYAKELWPYWHPDRDRNLVVFPHRLDPEKRPALFKMLENALGDKATFISTHENRSRSKPVYYDLLGKAKVVVSTSMHENFGYSMLEAAALGCNLVLPQGLSYSTTLPMVDGYRQDIEIIERVEAALTKRVLSPEDAYYHYDLKRFENAITSMVL